MSEKRVVSTAAAPQNDRPYSQATIADGFCFVSGQGPTDPDTGEQIEGDIQDQTRRTLENLRGIIQGAEADMSDVVKTTVYLDDIEDYDAVNEAYGDFFEEKPPARVCIEAARLPGDIGVEIEAIVHVG
jgi:2-iminobutanoate/2-iminopropanoate deaminase